MSWSMRYVIKLYRTGITGEALDADIAFLTAGTYATSGNVNEPILNTIQGAVTKAGAVLRALQSNLYVNGYLIIAGKPVGTDNPDTTAPLGAGFKDEKDYARVDFPNPALVLALRRANSAPVSGTGSNQPTLVLTDGDPETASPGD